MLSLLLEGNLNCDLRSERCSKALAPSSSRNDDQRLGPWGEGPPEIVVLLAICVVYDTSHWVAGYTLHPLFSSGGAKSGVLSQVRHTVAVDG